MNKKILGVLVLGLVLGGILGALLRPARVAKVSKETAVKKPVEVIKDLKTLTIAYLPQENPEELLPKAEAISKYFSKKLGMPVKTYVPIDYAAVIEALRAGHAQVAFISSWPYILAHEMADAWVIAGELREGLKFYFSQYYARKDSAINTLADLRGKTVAFSSPTSGSGYLFPVAKLVEEGLIKNGDEANTFFKAIVFSGGYEQSLKALVRGEVDAAGASDYAFSQYLTFEEQEKIKVISRQGPVPVHGVTVKGNLPHNLVARIQKAVLDLNEPENQQLLKLYGAEGYATVTHDLYSASVRKAVELTGFRYKLKK